MTDVAVLLTDDQIVLVLSVAMGNGARTEAEQTVLLELARSVDNEFVSWSGDVARTWQWRRCTNCEAVFDKDRTEDRCWSCRQGYADKGVPR